MVKTITNDIFMRKLKGAQRKKFVLAFSFELFYFHIFPNKSKQIYVILSTILHGRKIWSADTRDCRGEYLDLKKRK
jgi:hypothetical protein